MIIKVPFLSLCLSDFKYSKRCDQITEKGYFKRTKDVVFVPYHIKTFSSFCSCALHEHSPRKVFLESHKEKRVRKVLTPLNFSSERRVFNFRHCFPDEKNFSCPSEFLIQAFYFAKEHSESLMYFMKCSAYKLIRN